MQQSQLCIDDVKNAAISGLVVSSPSGAVSWALGGFSNSTVWLIFAAYMFAVGYTKTGLGKRLLSR